MKEIDTELNHAVAFDVEGTRRGRLAVVNLVGSLRLQGRVRPVTVVPIGEEEKFVSKRTPVDSYEDLSSAFILQCEVETFDNSDAVDIAQRTETMFDSFSFAPGFETGVDKLTALVCDDTGRHSVDSPDRSSQERADCEGSGAT